MPKRTILITGGAGNIGSSLAKKLVEDANNYIVIVDNLITGSIDNLPSADYTNWKFIKGNVNNYRDISTVMSSFSFNYVFHYAALVGVKRTLNNPLKVLKDIDGIRNVLSLSKNTAVKRVFYSSSSEVYGEPVEFPQNEETTPLNSRLNYAVVKNLGEVYLKTYKKEYNLDYTIFRFFNTYGPSQTDDFVIPIFIKAALAGADIKIYGDGSQVRTFCYIDDNIYTTIKILYEDLCVNEIINMGNDVEYTIEELAKIIIEITGSKSKIKYMPPLEEGDMTRRKPDNSKMKKIMNRDLISLEEGLRKIIQPKHLVKITSSN